MSYTKYIHTSKAYKCWTLYKHTSNTQVYNTRKKTKTHASSKNFCQFNEC